PPMIVLVPTAYAAVVSNQTFFVGLVVPSVVTSLLAGSWPWHCDPFGWKVLLSADVGHGLQDLDGAGAAVRQRVGGLLADLLAHDGGAERRPGRVDVDRRAALLAGGEQERHLVVVLDEPDRDRHARADHAVGPRRPADAGVLQDVLQDDDPR